MQRIIYVKCTSAPISCTGRSGLVCLDAKSFPVLSSPGEGVVPEPPHQAQAGPREGARDSHPHPHAHPSDHSSARAPHAAHNPSAHDHPSLHLPAHVHYLRSACHYLGAPYCRAYACTHAQSFRLLALSGWHDACRSNDVCYDLLQQQRGPSACVRRLGSSGTRRQRRTGGTCRMHLASGGSKASLAAPTAGPYGRAGLPHGRYSGQGEGRTRKPGSSGSRDVFLEELADTSRFLPFRHALRAALSFPPAPSPPSSSSRLAAPRPPAPALHLASVNEEGCCADGGDRLSNLGRMNIKSPYRDIHFRDM